MILTCSNLSYSEMRRVVLDHVLSITGFTQYGSILLGVAQSLIKRQLVSETGSHSFSHTSSYVELSNKDADLVNEIVWDLIIERVLSIGGDKNNPNWPFLRLTNYGRSLAGSSETVLIHDVDGMLKYLTDNVPRCDGIILTYLGECLETYRINKTLSSSVMLGCAAEKLVCLLFDAYLNWLTNKQGENSNEVKNLNKEKGRSISRQFEHLTESIKAHKNEIDSPLMEDYDLLVTAIFTIIRKNRNDAGHPTGKQISREELQPIIYVFIRYCIKVYSLIEFFGASN